MFTTNRKINESNFGIYTEYGAKMEYGVYNVVHVDILPKSNVFYSGVSAIIAVTNGYSNLFHGSNERKIQF